MSSTPESRAVARDYWTRADVIEWCSALDYAAGLFALCALMALGSLFN